MTRLPRMTGEELVAALGRAGFEAVRQRRSHVRVQHPDGRRTTVPLHAGEMIGPGLLSQILRQLEISRGDWLRLTSE